MHDDLILEGLTEEDLKGQKGQDMEESQSQGNPYILLLILYGLDNFVSLEIIV